MNDPRRHSPRQRLARQHPSQEQVTWDDEQDEDLLDEEWPPRTRTSVVRYQPAPHSIPPGTALVRTSAGRMQGVPARRSALTPRYTGAGYGWPPPAPVEREPQASPPPRQQAVRSRWHWSLWLGIGMFTITLGWLALSLLGTWWQTTQDDWHYGRPRTSQVDAVVGHNHDSPAHPSHFLALNLHRHILIIELPAGDPSKARIYSGPVLLGKVTPIVNTITTLDARQGVVSMHIQAEGTWAYHLSAAQLHRLVALVAGTLLHEARTTLLHTQGIHQVSIATNDWWDDAGQQALPSDPNRIQVVVISWIGV